MSKAERPTSKIALITGGGRGLGKAIALSLAEMGIRVVLTWNSNGATADEVVGQIRTAGGKAAALRLDVAATASFDDFFDRLQEVLQREFGATSIDFLINNAGFGQTIPIAQSTEADFDRFVNVHFKGVVFLTQMASAMVNDDGAVVYVTAAADRYHVPGYAAYAAWKGAVEVFSRYVAKEYGSRGIRANTVAPGGIVTDFNNAAIRSNPQVQQFLVA